jgi:hypothetical protein
MRQGVSKLADVSKSEYDISVATAVFLRVMNSNERLDES